MTTRSRPRLDIREEILHKIEERDLTWTQAHKELGVTRQTLYSWCGQHSFVPPSPKYAAEIAEFIDKPMKAVLEELLQMEAARHFDSKHFDVEVRLKRRTGKVSSRSAGSPASTSESSGAIPGYINSPSVDNAERTLCGVG
jgi:hypothetical protein